MPPDEQISRTAALLRPWYRRFLARRRDVEASSQVEQADDDQGQAA